MYLHNPYLYSIGISLVLMTLSLQPTLQIVDAWSPVDTVTPYCTVYTPAPFLLVDPVTLVFAIVIT